MNLSTQYFGDQSIVRVGRSEKKCKQNQQLLKALKEKNKLSLNSDNNTRIFDQQVIYRVKSEIPKIRLDFTATKFFDI